MITNNIATDASLVLSNVTTSLADTGNKVDLIYAEAGSHLGDAAAYPSSRVTQNTDADDRATLVSLFLPVENGGSHSEIQSISAADIRKSVDESYDFTLNVAKPIIISAYESIEKYMNGDKDAPSLVGQPAYDVRYKNEFAIVLDSLHPLLNNDIFMEMVDRAKVSETPSYTIVEDYSVNIIDPTDFFDTVKTGFDDIDNQVIELFTEPNTSNNNMPGYSIQWTLYDLLNGDVPADIKSLIRGFIMARYLAQKVEDVFKAKYDHATAENFSSAAYHFASEIMGGVRDRQSVIESRRLVKSLSSDNGYYTAILYPETYNQWIEAGGSADAIFGAMINSPAHYISYDELLEKAPENAATYQDHCLLERARLTEERVKSLSEYIKRVLKRVIENNWDAFESTRFSDSCGDFAFLDKITQGDLAGISPARLYMVVRDVLCQVLWIRSPVHAVMHSIDRAYKLVDSEKDTTLCAKRALEIAKIYHITDIVTAQMSVSLEK